MSIKAQHPPILDDDTDEELFLSDELKSDLRSPDEIRERIKLLNASLEGADGSKVSSSISFTLYEISTYQTILDIYAAYSYSEKMLINLFSSQYRKAKFRILIEQKRNTGATDLKNEFRYLRTLKYLLHPSIIEKIEMSMPVPITNIGEVQTAIR